MGSDPPLLRVGGFRPFVTVCGIFLLSVSLLLGIGARDTVYGDGYHDALLNMDNISPEQWAKKQKEQVVSLRQEAERRASEGRGALQAGTGMPFGKQEPGKQWWEKETGKISGKEKKGEGTVAVVDSPEMRSMADKLMEYLQYMIPKNILQTEFPNFPKDKIPEYRRRAKEILSEMGVGIVKQLIERIVTAKKGKGMGGFPDCTTAPDYVADLEDTLNEILTEASKSPAGAVALVQQLAELMTGGDNETANKAQSCLAKVLSKDIPLESPEDFLTLFEALQPLASQSKGALAGMIKARLQKMWSGASATLLLSVLEIGGADAAKCSLEEIDSRLRRNTPLLRETDLPVMEKALRLGSDPVRQEAKRILCHYFARCADEQKVKLLARNDEVGHVANEAVEELPHPNIVALIEMAERSGLKEVAQRLRDCAEKLRPTLPSTADGLLDALKSGEENKQAAALEKLIENANAEIAQRLEAEPQALTALLSSPRADLRLRAVRLCEKVKLKAAAPQLIDMLLDADDQVFRASCDALFRIVGQADLIPGPFDTPDERKKAVKALKQWWQKQGD